MPASRDVGANYREMKKNHPDWTHEHLQAAALSMAHEAGNPDVKPKKKEVELEDWEQEVVAAFPWDDWDSEEADAEKSVSVSLGTFFTGITQAVKDAFLPPPEADLPPTRPEHHAALFAKSRSLSDGSRLLSTKDADGRPRLTFWVSNNFRDSDHPPEILSAAAHQKFVEWSDKTGHRPEAWLWHTPGTRWGEVDWMDYFDGFLVESVLADKGKEAVAERIAADPDIRVSHGYVIPPGGRDSSDWSVIQTYYQYEISPLPVGKEANPLTGTVPLDLTPMLTGLHTTGDTTDQLVSALPQGGMKMPMNPDKRMWIVAKYGEESAVGVEEATAKLQNYAKMMGLQFKDLVKAVDGEPPSPEPPAPDPTPEPETPAPALYPVSTPTLTRAAIDVEASVKSAVESQFAGLNAFLTSMKADIDLLKAGHNKAVADQIRPPAGDSVEYLWGKRPTDSQNNLLSKEASDALGGPRDDSDKLPPHLVALSQLVPSLGPNGNGQRGPGDALSH